MHRFRWHRAAASALWLFLAAVASADTLPLPPGLIGLDSDDGARLLVERSTVREAYWPLSLQFVTQKNQAYCGVATSVMVLNALRLPAPPAPEIEPFATFTQDNLLNADTERILPRELLLKQGMTLDQAGALLSAHGAAVEVRHAEDGTLDDFREAAVQALGRRDRFVVVNYLRSAIGQVRGGHISPLAAYDAAGDRLLLLDVSRYKYPPVWVPTAGLFAAMNTPDSSNGQRSRGYLLVSGR